MKILAKELSNCQSDMCQLMTACPKTVDSPNKILQKITGGIFCTQFVQCNDGGAGDKCTFLSVLTYSSNLQTQICEIVQLTRWAHRKFLQHFPPSSRHKKHGECLVLLASKFRCSQHVNLKLWLFHVIGMIGVKWWRGIECVLSVSAKYSSLPDMSDVCLTFTEQFYNGLHNIVRQMSDVSLPHFAYTVLWGSETVYVSSPAKLCFWVPTLGLVSTSCGQTAALTPESGDF